MRKLAKVLWILSLILALTAPAIALDREADIGTIPGFANFDTSVIEVWCVGKGLSMYPEAEQDAYGDWGIVPYYKYGEFGQMGTGWVVQGGRFIITAAHVVTPSAILMKLTDTIEYIGPIVYATEMDIYVGKYKENKDERRLVQARIFYINEETDVAILVVNGSIPNFLTSMEMQLCDTVDVHYTPFGVWTNDLMDYGDTVASIVRQRDVLGNMKEGYEIRKGRIVSGGIVLPDGVDRKAEIWFNLNDVTMDTLIIPGDSGSPVVGWIRGVPYLIGIARAAASDGETGLSYFTRIDFIKIITEATFAKEKPKEEPKVETITPKEGTLKETTPLSSGPQRPLKWQILER
jgi:S1-C subfamily serine protease